MYIHTSYDPISEGRDEVEETFESLDDRYFVDDDDDDDDDEVSPVLPRVVGACYSNIQGDDLNVYVYLCPTTSSERDPY